MQRIDPTRYLDHRSSSCSKQIDPMLVHVWACMLELDLTTPRAIVQQTRGVAENGVDLQLHNIVGSR